MPKKLTKIASKEEMYFDKIYCSLKEKFPKECGCCGMVYENELEYNLKTKINGPLEKSRLMCVEELGKYLFLRNCECGNTLALQIDLQKFGKEDGEKFIQYIENKANYEGLSFNEAFEKEIVPEYNQYLEDRLNQ
jgi:hypothetical protein